MPINRRDELIKKNQVKLVNCVNFWKITLYARHIVFQLYIGENKLHFDEMMMMMTSVLNKTRTLSWIFIALDHWNHSPRIDMSLYSDTLFWFRSYQSLLLLLNAEYRRSNKYKIYSIWFDTTGAQTHDLSHSKCTR